MKKLFTIIILFVQLTYSQNLDSLSTKTDTLSNSFKADSLSITDSTKIVVVDTLHPIYLEPLYSGSRFISRNDIVRSDYKYAGDLLKLSDFSFTRDFGFIGQPNETSIYGAGFGSVSFLEDGILLNNRVFNSFDLNLVQSESIDSIEIVPLTRGFLYSPLNNTATVNFISKDFLSRPAYTRIKYYQGPNGQAMVDGFFNSWIYKRVDLSFDITNRKVDDRYYNSSLGEWQTSLKLKYFLNDKINITGSFQYKTLERGLNGGVNVDSIIVTGGDLNSEIYSELLAPVNSYNGTEQMRQQYYNIKMFARFAKYSKTDLTFYYRKDFDEIAGGNDSTFYSDKNSENIWGIHFVQNLSFEPIDFTLLANYEKYDLNFEELRGDYLTPANYNSTVYSVAGIFTVKTKNNLLTPSIFYKISHNSYYVNNESSKGGGLDLKVNLENNFSFYTGYSFYSILGNKDTKNFEISVAYNSDYLASSVKYFSISKYYPSSFPLPFAYPAAQEASVYQPPYLNLEGFGGQLNFKFWNLEFENSAAYYKNPDNSSGLSYNVPQYTYRGGLYYNDILFKDNLDLKAGLVFYYYGERKPKENNKYIQTLSANNRLDLKINGIIQKVAIVYFAWENLLNKKYFIVPYYPMPGRTIRFGIAWELFN